MQVSGPPEDRGPWPDPVRKRASRHATARVDFGAAASQRDGRHALPARALTRRRAQKVKRSRPRVELGNTLPSRMLDPRYLTTLEGRILMYAGIFRRSVATLIDLVALASVLTYIVQRPPIAGAPWA